MHYRYKTILWISLAIPVYAMSAPATPVVIATTGVAETVFSWSKDRCFDENIPDSPARAFRSSTTQVYLYATHYKNTPLVGDSISQVKPACKIQFAAALNEDPDQYDARIWLQTFYNTNGGQYVYSLGSADYHGKWFDKCKVIKPRSHDCWMNAIVLAYSNDGGKTFSSSPPPRHLVANSPQKFVANQRGTIGFLTTSNIANKDDYYYALFNTAAYKNQRIGNCLARTDDLSSAGSWRAWDENSFKTPLIHTPSLDSNGYTCKTLPTLSSKIPSLLWHEKSQGYIATFEKVKRIRRRDARTDVIFAYSWSADLRTWTKPEKIFTLQGDARCKTPQTRGAYPSIIDSTSKDGNFGTVGLTAHLYYTKFNLGPHCGLTLDRDLVRIPISINTRPAYQPAF